jgi:hypothetical protein
LSFNKITEQQNGNQTKNFKRVHVIGFNRKIIRFYKVKRYDYIEPPCPASWL